MLDDLRNSASQFIEEESPPEDESAPVRPAARREPLLGITAQQRFILAVMLLLMTCLLGSFCLLISGKIWLPFF